MFYGNFYRISNLSIYKFKVKKFNTDLNQINDWISLKQCQNEFDAFTRVKPSQADRTILLAESTPYTNENQQNDESSLSSDESGVLQLIESYKSDLSSLETDWLRQDPTLSTLPPVQDSHLQLISPYITQKCLFVRRRLERLEASQKLKLESNLAELRHSFARNVHDIFGKLSDEMSYVKCGKLTTLAELESSIRVIERLLDQLDHSRGEMRAVLDKYEAQLRLSVAETVLKLDELDPLDPKRLSGLSNRDLEMSCRCLLDKMRSSEIATVWSQYESLHGQLNSRLDQTMCAIQRDLGNVDRLVVDEMSSCLVTKSSLYEPVVRDMLENKRVFDDFEEVTKRLNDILEQSINQKAE